MKNIFISISIFIVVITNWHCSTQKLKETEIHNSERRVIEDMIFVEGGTFEMGSKDGESDEKPVHNVELDDFYISKYEVTQNEWQEVMGNNPSLFLGDYLPVEKVSWNDIQEFLQILNAKIGGNYRLPTEAEWEYAARGGNKYSDYKYSGSNNIDEVAWYDGNSGNKTHRVGIKKANGLGIYDMTGNVWEWCSDWYGENYYSESSSSNPQGPSNGTYRVLRGGSCVTGNVVCRIVERNGRYPVNRGHDGNYGFRLVRDK